MDISKLVLIALVGLALFGGAINIDFKGLIGRREGRGLKGGKRKLLGK